jgi:putative membrane protein
MAKPVGPRLFNAFRGTLIGAAEVVPGISGGTVALITGVYEHLIGGAGHITSGLRQALADVPRGRGTDRAKERFRQVEWGVVAPLLVGMAAALVLGAKLIAPLVEEHPQYSYGLFFGLVLASLYVPYSNSGQRWKAGHYALALVVATGAFFLTGMPPANVPTNPVIVFFAGAIAICALVLPGVSGSFLLLTLGLYEPTMDAVNERDLGYVAVFGTGCIVGLALFVKLLKWLLENYHHMTLVVMTGLMAGSLRALWPWQDDDRGILAPSGSVGVTFALVALGVVLVVAVLVVERRAHARKERDGSDEEPPPARRGRHARVPSA